ncbi:YqaJ viral recombinase family protein [Photobacterium damselae subsp. damselae]|uniref:lambda-exonuclease family protein n=1 Tax=Photobacterium damselae TaxID=38293 RepID=UPI001F380CCC|nr:YqaJ viral recombinase family protein [Photobacterium damselae]UKA08673.1 YqaJ viral recombinase family protein [Photobacterium damselae subsp. damselae]UKA22933.1 YqaJ viral recombinase family protein [Photobacterium damselae subsp. damselae]
MKIVNVKQGTQAWLELRQSKFTASEAPAAMGESKYQSRDALLKMKATGETPEINSYQEKIFAKGHAAEEAARPLVENIIGDELFPATAISDEYDWMLASFDGITIMEDVVFEHKLFNHNLHERVLNNDLEPHYYWQLEQQLLVSGAKKAIFVCSDGTSDNFASCEYYSQPERREQLITGWLQFQKDLASYSSKPETEKIEAEPTRDLPTICYKMDGLTLNSNLDTFKQAATDLVEKSKLPIETDQDFANAEHMVKTFKTAEDKIKALSEQVLGEVQSIDSFVKDLKFIGEQIRQARLATDKQVKNRKDEIRKQILATANKKIQQHTLQLEKQIKASLPAPTISVLNAMKGKKTVQSLQEAADTAVSQVIVELDLQANKARKNLICLNQNAKYKFLFSDWNSLCFKENDDFDALITSRIAKHKEAEKQRLEQERLGIQQEESQPIVHKTLGSESTEPSPSNSSFKLNAETTAALSGKFVSTNNIASKTLMVQLTAKEANYLRQRDAILTALENAGVDNWVGYSNAIATLQSAQNVA